MNDRMPMKRRKNAQAELKPGEEAAVMGCVGSYWGSMVSVLYHKLGLALRLTGIAALKTGVKIAAYENQ